MINGPEETISISPDFSRRSDLEKSLERWNNEYVEIVLVLLVVGGVRWGREGGGRRGRGGIGRGRMGAIEY